MLSILRLTVAKDDMIGLIKLSSCFPTVPNVAMRLVPVFNSTEILRGMRNACVRARNEDKDDRGSSSGLAARSSAVAGASRAGGSEPTWSMLTVLLSLAHPTGVVLLWLAHLLNKCRCYLI